MKKQRIFTIIVILLISYLIVNVTTALAMPHFYQEIQLNLGDIQMGSEKNDDN